MLMLMRVGHNALLVSTRIITRVLVVMNTSNSISIRIVIGCDVVDVLLVDSGLILIVVVVVVIVDNCIARTGRLVDSSRNNTVALDTRSVSGLVVHVVVVAVAQVAARVVYEHVGGDQMRDLTRTSTHRVVRLDACLGGVIVLAVAFVCVMAAAATAVVYGVVGGGGSGGGGV